MHQGRDRQRLALEVAPQIERIGEPPLREHKVSRANFAAEVMKSVMGPAGGYAQHLVTSSGNAIPLEGMNLSFSP
jgi:hypothetical protein